MPARAGEHLRSGSLLVSMPLIENRSGSESRLRDQDFFIQEHLGEAWHVESEANCEVMLCEKWISSDNMSVRIQSRWGTRKCPECWIILEKVKRERRGY